MQVFKQSQAILKTAGSICLGIALSINAAACATPDNLAQGQQEAISILEEYLKIDTSNPPGNETKGAVFLSKVLSDNGLEPRIFEVAPGRSCVFARLKGNGSKRAVVLLNHIDVVPARAEEWQIQPFSGQERGGDIWGRGALDMKGMGVAELEALLMLKRSGKALERDVIFLATADEEAGGKSGAAWFVKNQLELIKNAEFLFNEGAFIDTANDGKARYAGVGVAEKSVLWLSLTTKGEAGHASLPMPDSSVNKLVRALDRIVENPPAPTVLPAVHEYFARIARTMQEPLKSAFANIEEAVKKPELYRTILADKFKSSMLRNTISATVLKAGYKTNVIPGEAYAELDCRLLPSTTREKFIESIRETIKDDAVEIKPIDSLHADASPYDTECFRAISRVIEKNLPSVPVVPMIIPWFTDSHWFREVGICSYGFIPFKVDETHIAGMHGRDERLPVDSFKLGVKIMYEVLEDLCAVKR